MTLHIAVSRVSDSSHRSLCGDFLCLNHPRKQKWEEASRFFKAFIAESHGSAYCFYGESASPCTVTKANQNEPLLWKIAVL